MSPSLKIYFPCGEVNAYWLRLVSLIEPRTTSYGLTIENYYFSFFLFFVVVVVVVVFNALPNFLPTSNFAEFI